MGDLLLKQKPRPVTHWQPTEMIRRPWPPMYRAPFQRTNQQFNFRPVDPSDWREPPRGYATNAFSHNNIYQTNKSRDYYFLAPFYRNAMPPPPKPQNDRLLMVDTTKKKSGKRFVEERCNCRSRSMDDVRFDVVEVSPDFDADENGNQVERTKKLKGGFKGIFGQHSVENLLADTMYTASPKRMGSYQVVNLFLVIF